MAILFKECRHHSAVNLQVSAGGQGATRNSCTVDSDGEAVDTRAGNSEDTSLQVVAATQVDEDMFVDNELVFSEGAKANQTSVIVKSN